MYSIHNGNCLNDRKPQRFHGNSLTWENLKPALSLTNNGSLYGLAYPQHIGSVDPVDFALMTPHTYDSMKDLIQTKSLGQTRIVQKLPLFKPGRMFCVNFDRFLEVEENSTKTENPDSSSNQITSFLNIDTSGTTLSPQGLNPSEVTTVKRTRPRSASSMLSKRTNQSCTIKGPCASVEAWDANWSVTTSPFAFMSLHSENDSASLHHNLESVQPPIPSIGNCVPASLLPFYSLKNLLSLVPVQMRHRIPLSQSNKTLFKRELEKVILDTNPFVLEDEKLPNFDMHPFLASVHNSTNLLRDVSLYSNKPVVCPVKSSPIIDRLRTSAQALINHVQSTTNRLILKSRLHFILDEKHNKLWFHFVSQLTLAPTRLPPHHPLYLTPPPSITVFSNKSVHHSILKKTLPSSAASLDTFFDPNENFRAVPPVSSRLWIRRKPSSATKRRDDNPFLNNNEFLSNRPSEAHERKVKSMSSLDILGKCAGFFCSSASGASWIHQLDMEASWMLTARSLTKLRTAEPYLLLSSSLIPILGGQGLAHGDDPIAVNKLLNDLRTRGAEVTGGLREVCVKDVLETILEAKEALSNPLELLERAKSVPRTTQPFLRSPSSIIHAREADQESQKLKNDSPGIKRASSAKKLKNSGQYIWDSTRKSCRRCSGVHTKPLFEFRSGKHIGDAPHLCSKCNEDTIARTLQLAMLGLKSHIKTSVSENYDDNYISSLFTPRSRELIDQTEAFDLSTTTENPRLKEDKKIDLDKEFALFNDAPLKNSASIVLTAINAANHSFREVTARNSNVSTPGTPQSNFFPSFSNTDANNYTAKPLPHMVTGRAVPTSIFDILTAHKSISLTNSENLTTPWTIDRLFGSKLLLCDACWSIFMRMKTCRERIWEAELAKSDVDFRSPLALSAVMAPRGEKKNRRRGGVRDWKQLGMGILGEEPTIAVVNGREEEARLEDNLRVTKQEQQQAAAYARRSKYERKSSYLSSQIHDNHHDSCGGFYGSSAIKRNRDEASTKERFSSRSVMTLHHPHHSQSPSQQYDETTDYQDKIQSNNNVDNQTKTEEPYKHVLVKRPTALTVANFSELMRSEEYEGFSAQESNHDEDEKLERLAQGNQYLVNQHQNLMFRMSKGLERNNDNDAALLNHLEMPALHQQQRSSLFSSQNSLFFSELKERNSDDDQLHFRSPKTNKTIKKNDGDNRSDFLPRSTVKSARFFNQRPSSSFSDISKQQELESKVRLLDPHPDSAVGRHCEQSGEFALRRRTRIRKMIERSQSDFDLGLEFLQGHHAIKLAGEDDDDNEAAGDDAEGNIPLPQEIDDRTRLLAEKDVLRDSPLRKKAQIKLASKSLAASVDLKISPKRSLSANSFGNSPQFVSPAETGESGKPLCSLEGMVNSYIVDRRLHFLMSGCADKPGKPMFESVRPLRETFNPLNPSHKKAMFQTLQQAIIGAKQENDMKNGRLYISEARLWNAINSFKDLEGKSARARRTSLIF